MRKLLVVLALLVPATASARPRKHVPKVSMDDARKTALGRIPGEVKASELEKEHGIWIYSFEIKPTGGKKGVIKEVNVNADTGAVVNVETEHE